MNPLDWLYPPVCMSCRNIIPIREKQIRKFRLCDSCRGLLLEVPFPACPRCGGVNDEDSGSCPSCFNKTFIFTHNTALFLYDGILRDILHDIKYRSRKQAALGLSELWAESLKEAPDADVIVPVPMHPKKLRARGFNQAEVLARAISVKFNIPLRKNFLKRKVNTPAQSGLNARARAENVRGVFVLNKKSDAEGKKIILVDDIFTTGVSLNECASVLTQAGAAIITAMTLTVTVKKSVNGNRSSDDKQT